MFLLQCTVTCGGGVRTRNITCTKNNGEPCDISRRPHSRALCGLQQCPSSRRFLIPHFKLPNGKIIRRMGTNPRRGPTDQVPTPKPSQRIQTATEIPEPQNVTWIPTYFGSMNSSQEDLEAKIIPHNSSGPSVPHNFSDIFTGVNLQQNTTSVTIASNASVANCTHVGNVSNTELGPTSSKVGFTSGDSLTIYSTHRTVTLSYNDLTEESEIMSHSSSGGAKGNPKTEWLTRPSITHRTSKASPTIYHHDTFTPVSGSPTEQTVSLTTVGLKGHSVQVSTPALADTVTIQPTPLGNIARDNSVNRTKLKFPINRTSTLPAENPPLWVTSVPKNTNAASQRMWLNVSKPERSKELGNSSPEVHWMLGNWSEVSVVR